MNIHNFLDKFCQNIIYINISYILSLSLLFIFNVFGLQNIWNYLLWFKINGVDILFSPIMLVYMIAYFSTHKITKKNVIFCAKKMILCSIINIIIFYMIIIFVFMPFLYQGEQV